MDEHLGIVNTFPASSFDSLVEFSILSAYECSWRSSKFGIESASQIQKSSLCYEVSSTKFCIRLRVVDNLIAYFDPAKYPFVPAYVCWKPFWWSMFPIWEIRAADVIILIYLYPVQSCLNPFFSQSLIIIDVSDPIRS